MEHFDHTMTLTELFPAPDALWLKGQKHLKIFSRNETPTVYVTHEIVTRKCRH